MSNYFGGFSLFNTGLQTVSGIGFQGNELEFTLGSKSGSSTSTLVLCQGSVDSTNYVTAQSWYYDTTGMKYIESTSKCISVWERVSGTLTEVINATFNSWTSDGFKLSVTAYSSSYQIFAKVRN